MGSAELFGRSGVRSGAAQVMRQSSLASPRGGDGRCIVESGLTTRRRRVLYCALCDGKLTACVEGGGRGREGEFDFSTS